MGSPIRVQLVTVTPIQQNCTLVWCTATMRAAVVDPGGDLPLIHAAIARAGVAVERILITHGHIDHAGAARPLADVLGVPIEGPALGDRPLLAALATQGERWGIPGTPFEPDRWLVEGDKVSVGDLVLDVYETPGHSPGHVVFHHPPSRLALVGDTLFQGSIGRTDLPGGDHAQLLHSIRAKLWPLGDDTHFIPGHGRPGTIGHERRHNPFVGEAAPAG